MLLRAWFAAVTCLALAACPGDPGVLPDGGGGAPADGGSSDGGDSDGGTTPDSGTPWDGGSDAGWAKDGGPDAGTFDGGRSDGGADGGRMWVTAYIAGWALNAPPGGNYGPLPAVEVDYRAFTHAVLFALTVKADGSLCCIADYDTFAPDRIRAVVDGGHQAGRPVLFSIGGAGNTEFATAIGPSTRAALVGNVVGVLTTWGFDGVDLDLEPINPGDEASFAAFVNALHAALQARATPLLPRPLLTAACGNNPALFASLAPKFDQINLMTYDLSGAWPGWVTWHNAPVYNGGYRFPSSNGLVPSADALVEGYLDAGVPPGRLGIGLDFYGYVWSGGAGTPTGGVTAPRQEYSTAPTVQGNVSYAALMDTLFAPARRRWDSAALAVYLSIDEPGSANDKFVSYDDAQTAQAKADYIRARGLGGMILWELSGGWQPAKPAGQRDALLQSVRAAAGL